MTIFKVYSVHLIVVLSKLVCALHIQVNLVLIILRTLGKFEIILLISKIYYSYI